MKLPRFVENLTEGRTRSKATRILKLTLSILLLAPFVFCAWIYFQDRDLFSQLFGARHTELPFFSRENFDRIRVGMSGDEVRDLVGYPHQRFNDEWWYIRFVEWPIVEPTSTNFAVVFNPANDTVVRKYVQSMPYPLDNLPYMKKVRREVGTLRLFGTGGKTRLLAESDDRAVILRCVPVKPPIGPGTVQTALTSHRGWVEKHSPWLKNPKATLIYILFPPADDFPDARKFLSKQKSGFEDVFTLEDPLGYTKAPAGRVLLYRRGTLYHVPPLTLTHEDAARDDHKWVIDKLVGDE